jgi:ATP-binding cassette subfamily F protein 3
MLRLDRAAREQDLRDYLGGFDFRGNVVDAPVGRFSGGEKARLTLALLIWQRPNLLLLDEPTNHLDLEMRQALTMALQEFEGALVLVSHDRYLLRATTDSLLLVADGGVAPFDGDLDDYRVWLDGRRRQEVAGESEAAQPATSRREQRRQEAEARQRLAAQRRPLAQRLREVEQELEQLAREKQRLETLAADPQLYDSSNRERLKASLLEQSRVTGRLQELESQWLELQTQLEALEA